MPGKSDLSKLNCSLAGALNVVGDWWTLLIVRDALLGLRRFGEFQQSLGLAKNILADRLQRLIAADVLRRQGPERRPIYRLTKKGFALAPAITALMQWGDEWIAAGRPPVVVTDAAGRRLDPVRLSAKGRPVGPTELQFQAGPGARPRTRALLSKLSGRKKLQDQSSASHFDD